MIPPGLKDHGPVIICKITYLSSILFYFKLLVDSLVNSSAFVHICPIRSEIWFDKLSSCHEIHWCTVEGTMQLKIEKSIISTMSFPH